MGKLDSRNIICVVAAALFMLPAMAMAEVAPSVGGAEAKVKKHFLWKVEGGKKPLYLLGSVHVAKPEIYPLPQALENAFKASDNLVVEVDLTSIDQQAVARQVMAHGMYKPGMDLEKDLDKDTYKQLAEVSKKLGIPLMAMHRMKPVMVAQTLTMRELARHGYQPSNGIDMYFTKSAKKQRKPIKQLETMEGQLEMMLGMKDDKNLILQTIDNLKRLKPMMEGAFKAWNAGDAAALDDLMIHGELKRHPEYKDVYQTLFFDRNVTMTDKIVKYLNSDQSHFVVVGAGHLVGKKSINDLLEQKGYTLTQL